MKRSFCRRLHLFRSERCWPRSASGRTHEGTDYTPPGVEHWHGAGPNDELVQLGIVPGGGGIQFKEEVSEAQYSGKSR